MLTNRYISVDIVNQTRHSHLLLMPQVCYKELLLLLLQLRLLQNHHIPKVSIYFPMAIHLIVCAAWLLLVYTQILHPLIVTADICAGAFNEEADDAIEIFKLVKLIGKVMFCITPSGTAISIPQSLYSYYQYRDICTSCSIISITS